MREYYRKRAPVYDRVYAYPERKRDLDCLHAYVKERMSGRRVLEVAAGTGYWTQYIAASADAVVATDMAEETLAIARSRSGVGNVTFRVADAYQLNRLGDGFDGLFAGLWISHVPRERRSEFFAGIHNLIRPGGLVLLIDNTKSQCQRLPITQTDESGNTYQNRVLDDGSVHRVLKNFPTRHELTEMTEPFAGSSEYILLDHFWAYSYYAK